MRVVQSERKKLTRKEFIISGGSGALVQNAQGVAVTGAVLTDIMKGKGGDKDE